LASQTQDLRDTIKSNAKTAKLLKECEKERDAGQAKLAQFKERMNSLRKLNQQMEKKC